MVGYSKGLEAWTPESLSQLQEGSGICWVLAARAKSQDSWVLSHYRNGVIVWLGEGLGAKMPGFLSPLNPQFSCPIPLPR